MAVLSAVTLVTALSFVSLGSAAGIDNSSSPLASPSSGPPTPTPPPTGTPTSPLATGDISTGFTTNAAGQEQLQLFCSTDAYSAQLLQHYIGLTTDLPLACECVSSLSSWSVSGLFVNRTLLVPIV